jgi:hypothetical protein
MKTHAELQAEVTRLNQIKHLDESGVTVRMITLIALEWAMGQNPVSPSERLEEVNEEAARDGAINYERQPD